MPIHTALLAVLVEADCLLAPDQIAKSFNTEEEAVRCRLKALAETGYVVEENGMFRAADGAKEAVILNEFKQRKPA